MVVVMPAARPVVMVVIRHFFARGLFLRQQGRFKSELAQRVLDFFDRGFVLGQRKVQPFAGNRDLDVANAGQAGKRGFDLRRAAAAIHPTDREGQFLRFPVQTAACRNIHGFAPEFQSTVNLAPLATRASRGKMQFFDFF